MLSLLARAHQLLREDACDRGPFRWRHARPDPAARETVVPVRETAAGTDPAGGDAGRRHSRRRARGAGAGDRAIVVGAGPIGLSVIEFLRVAGADIGVVEKMPERLEFAARHHGLQRYYPSHEEARQEEPSMLVFDCTGDKPRWKARSNCCSRAAPVFVGTVNNTVALFDPDLHRREATILASRNSTPAEHHRVLD